MKIAIVTGASSGLGRSFIRELDKQGGLDEIWGVARRRERMEELAGELATPMRPLALDLTKMESVETLRTLLKETGADVRVLVNSAGFGKFGTYADMTLQETADMIDLNSRALRWEVAPRGIKVTAVCPGWIKTEFMDVAKDTKNGRTVRSYPFALRPETVARRALRDSQVLAVTTCGLPALVQRTASKFLPHCFIMACWEGLRRI